MLFCVQTTIALRYYRTRKCLDQIESYIDEQRNRDDHLFNETIKRVDDGIVGGVDSSQLNFSEIALEGKRTV